MIVDLKIFKEVISILRNNTFQNVIDSLSALRLHRDLVEDNYLAEMEELRHILVHYKKYEAQVDFRVYGINKINIEPWVPLLKKHQQSAIYPNVKSATVNQITEAKKELESLSYSLDELKMKVKGQARKAKNASNALLRAKKQIFVLETVADVQGFLNMNNYKATEIAEFEMNKYYELYRKSGV